MTSDELNEAIEKILKDLSVDTQKQVLRALMRYQNIDGLDLEEVLEQELDRENTEAWSTKRSKIKAFIDKITPPNWNIYIKKEEFKYKPGTLNIKLEVFKNESDWLDEWDDDAEDWIGRVKGPMCFYLKSEFIKNEPRVIEPIKKFGVGKIGRSHLQINPDRETRELLDTLVEELAHIAADRWLAYKTKEYNKEWKCEIDSLSLRDENINHGPLFKKAFSLITIRKEKAFGKESDEKIWEKLEGLI